MPRTIVSGGTGYVGRFVVERLIADGHEVAVLARKPPPESFFSRPVAHLHLSLEDEADPAPLFSSADAFVHAAFDHVPGRYRGGEGDDAEGFRRRNQYGSMRLFEAARAAGVGRAVFFSSRAVYGTQPRGKALTEETRPHPDTLYGEVKRAVERQLAGLDDDGFVATSLRLTGVYGPAGAGRVCKWTPLIRDYLDGRPVAPHAGTEVHGDDVAAAVALVLSAPPAAVRASVFNVSDLIVERSDLLAAVQRMTGCPHPLPAVADVSGLNVMDTTRLQSLGWTPGRLSALREYLDALVSRLVAERQRPQ